MSLRLLRSGPTLARAVGAVLRHSRPTFAVAACPGARRRELSSTRPLRIAPSDDRDNLQAPEEPLGAAPALNRNEAPDAAVSPSEAWSRAGVDEKVIERLTSSYPDVVAPTAAQLAFLLAFMRGNVDVYFKDYMGRGKTFTLVLAALSTALKGGQTVILLPSPHLIQQVADLIDTLRPDGVTVCNLAEGPRLDSSAGLIVATPDLLLASTEGPLHQALPNLSHVLIDEADTQLGPVPPRYITPDRLVRHPINRHPPSVILALNSLLNIQESADGNLDFSGRTNAHTVWSSATLSTNLKRFVYGRGWARGSDGGGLLDLNFTSRASDRQLALRETLAEIAKQLGAVSGAPPQRQPDHFAFTVDTRGVLEPLGDRKGRWAHELGESAKHPKLGSQPSDMPSTLVEGLAFLQASSPPPPGTYALAVLPDTAPLKAVSAELTKLRIPVVPLVPEALVGGVPPPPEDLVAPILVATRSSVPGLHLPHLHTVYLLNGLDLSSLTKAQRKAQGRRMREMLYTIVTGRLGRFATATQAQDSRQRIISLVPQGSEDEAALKDLFAGLRGDMPFKLKKWEGPL